jgi:crotonobetainyl-CoA:carnitine CoA-transferase CaiB-like acyl-CoA transferase
VLVVIPADVLPFKHGPGLDLLKGVSVLDLTTSVAGPYAGQLLGDMGADVIKIEKPGSGDDCRAWGPPFLDGESLWFLSVNRNKRSVALDYAKSEGFALLQRLVAQTDILLVNVTARVQKKLSIDHAALSAIKPNLIHISITGFGLTGDRADLPCYDLIAEGYSGVMDMTGEIDGPPQKVGSPAADLLAGEDAAMAAVAALVRRGRTGEGAVIDVSLSESMTRFMSPRLLPHLGSGETWRRSGGRDSVIAIYQAFETADKPITLGLGNDAIWRRFWAAVGAPELAENPAHANNALRRQDRSAIVVRIAKVLLTKTSDEWLELFRSARVPAGPINRLDEIGSDQRLQDRGFIYALERDAVKVPQIGLGIHFDGHSEIAAAPPPRLGADTLSVLLDAGVDSVDLAALAAKKIIQLGIDHEL